MQYQKEETRNTILMSARKEFKKHGYLEAAISTIAKNADVPIGNMYRYFKSKEELFSAVVGDAYENLPNEIITIYMQDKSHPNSVENIASTVAESIMHIYDAYADGLLILAYKSTGTKYSNFLPNLKAQISSMFLDYLYKNSTKQDELISSIISNGFLDGILQIMQCCDKEEVKIAINRLMLFYFYQIDSRV